MIKTRFFVYFLAIYWTFCFVYMFSQLPWTPDPIAGSSGPVRYGFHDHGVFPSPKTSTDRILEQLNLTVTDGDKTKLILLWSKFNDVSSENIDSLLDNCPVQQCKITKDRKMAPEADVIMTKDFGAQLYDYTYGHTRRPEQIIAWYQLESPKNSVVPKGVLVNWTATFRRDSTLSTPYYKYVTDTSHIDYHSKPLTKNYAKGKTKMAAWFVSNCGSSNRRIVFAHELKKYIPVDIYGHCGDLKCSKGKNDVCHKMLKKDYKFYLSLENSNCRDYITEKFYEKGLSNDIVPIVMGATQEDYRAVAPPHSYIHMDDFESPRHLADYLKVLDANDTLYNEYFRWKGHGEFINTKFWCRLCSLVHTAHVTDTHMWYDDLTTWWKGPGTCTPRDTSRPWSSWLDSPNTSVYRRFVQFIKSLTL